MDGGAHSKEAEVWDIRKMRKHNRNASVIAKAHVIVGFHVRLFYRQGIFQAGTGSSHTQLQWAGHEWALKQELCHCSYGGPEPELISPAERNTATGLPFGLENKLSKLMSGNWKLYRCIFAFMCIKMGQFLPPVYLWLELRFLKLSKGPCLYKHSPVCKKTSGGEHSFFLCVNSCLQWSQG